jgi:hypothetical protein
VNITGIKPLLFGAVLASVFSGHALGDVGRSQAYQAIDNMVEELAEDLQPLEGKIGRIGITGFSQSKELEFDLRSFVIARLEAIRLEEADDEPEEDDDSEKAKQKSSSSRTVIIKPKTRFVRCVGCFTPRAISKGDRIIIRKGFTHQDQLKRVLHKMGVKYYVNVNLDYSDDEMILQLSMYDSSGKPFRSYQATSHTSSPDRSGVVLGFGMINAEYDNSDVPTLQGGRVTLGQRIVGYGDLGLAFTSISSGDGFPEQTSTGLYTDISFNELFGSYGDYIGYSLPVHLGVTDFNGDVQTYMEAGLKFRVGTYFFLSYTQRQHSFSSDPKNDGDLEIQQEEDITTYPSDKAIPTATFMSFGFEFVL